jgi:hypothetical protein
MWTRAQSCWAFPGLLPLSSIRKGEKPQKSPVKLAASIGFHQDSKRVASEIKSHHNPDFLLQILSKAAKLVSRSTFGASVTPKQVKSFTAHTDLFSLELLKWHDSHNNFLNMYLQFSTVISGEAGEAGSYRRN